MKAPTGNTIAVAALAAGLVMVGSMSGFSATRGSVDPTLDDPTIVAMTKDHADAMQKLRALHGAAFDRAFLAHEVAYHKAVLDAVTTTLLPALQNAEVKDLVTKVAPAFNAHMVRAQSLLDAYPK